MKKLTKTSELMWIFGTLFVALGVAICSNANLGVSMIAAPAFVLYDAFHSLLPNWDFFSVGMMEYAFQGVLLIIMCLIVRKFRWQYLLAFISAVIYGYALDLFLFLFEVLNISFDAIYLRWIMLIVGDIVTAFGVACYFRTYLPLVVYELFVSEVAKTYKMMIKKMKWIFDISLLVISISLVLILFIDDVFLFDYSTILYNCIHNIGLGTIVTTIINAPIIAFLGKMIDKVFNPTPLFPKLKKILA